MSDFKIKTKNRKIINADDVLVNEGGTLIKYIEPYSHNVVVLNIDEVSEVWRERTGWFGGEKFNTQKDKNWNRPC